MLRQCAWCLRLIDCAGERVSVQPLPKLYEASHGMCSVCGILWIEQVFNPLTPQATSLHLEELNDQEIEHVAQNSSSPQWIAGLPIQQQGNTAAPMMICENSSPYSSQVSNPQPEEEETFLEDQVPYS